VIHVSAEAQDSGHELMRQLNDETAAYAAESEAGGVLHLHWGFLCECGERGCREWVELTRDEYADLRRAGRAVLAPSHTPASSSNAPGASTSGGLES